MEAKIIILDATPRPRRREIELCHFGCPLSTGKCQHGSLPTITLSGIKYDIVIESQLAITFRGSFSKDRIEFSREGTDFSWKCRVVKWNGTAVFNHFSRIEQAHHILRDILEEIEF